VTAVAEHRNGPRAPVRASHPSTRTERLTSAAANYRGTMHKSSRPGQMVTRITQVLEEPKGRPRDAIDIVIAHAHAHVHERPAGV
jgi:hypothetical protein